MVYNKSLLMSKMLMFKFILITIMSLFADSFENKPWKGEEYVSTLFRRTPIPIWRRTPPTILPNKTENNLIPIWRRTPPPILPNKTENNLIPIWRRTQPPILPNKTENNLIPIWKRTPPPQTLFLNRDLNNSWVLQQGDKFRVKTLNKTDDEKTMKWIIRDIYYPKKRDLARQSEIKNMGRWILRWDLYDNKFKFGKSNRTDYIMYSRWRFLYEPPISNIIDFFKNL